jgi:ribose-phosphate pyrophosphokinase
MADVLKVFSGSANRPLAEKMCAHMGVPLGKMSLTRFPDGEIFCKIEEDVRGRDCYIVQPTSPPVNEHLMELLVMADSFRRASAQRITAVMPYFGYARQDRKDEGRVPITAKLAANIITVSGVHRVVALDLHAAQVQGFFDSPVDHLIAVPTMLKHLKARGYSPDELAIVSPDVGRIKLATRFHEALGGTLAIIDKRRTSATETQQAHIIGGPVLGRVALVFDDMLSTGGSICGAAEALVKHGARQVHVCVSHGLFVGNAVERLAAAPIDSIMVTDTVVPPAAVGELKVETMSVAPLLGEAIKRIHLNQSVSYLFDRNNGN